MVLIQSSNNHKADKIYIYLTVYFVEKAKTLFKENNKTTLAKIVFFWFLILVIFMIVTKSEMKNIVLNQFGFINNTKNFLSFPIDYKYI